MPKIQIVFPHISPRSFDQNTMLWMSGHQPTTCSPIRHHHLYLHLYDLTLGENIDSDNRANSLRSSTNLFRHYPGTGVQNLTDRMNRGDSMEYKKANCLDRYRPMGLS